MITGSAHDGRRSSAPPPNADAAVAAAVDEPGPAPEAASAPLLAPGVTLGATAATAMLGPSLFPKDRVLQRIGMVGAAAVYLGIGVGVEGVSRGVDDVLPGDRLDAQLAVGGGGAAVAGAVEIGSRLSGRRAVNGPAALRTAGLLLAAGGLAGAASTLVARADEKIPGHDLLAQGGVAALAGTAMLGVSLHGMRSLKGVSPLLPDLVRLTPEGGQLGADVAHLAVEKPRGSQGAFTSGAKTNPLGEATSSPVDFAKMPGQGQRFLGEMPSADEIRDVMFGSTGHEIANSIGGRTREEVREPARTYVGLDHSPEGLSEFEAVKARVALAVEDLDHNGVFGRFETAADGTVRTVHAPRAGIMVAAPTSSGFVNPVAASSFEFGHLGDTAVVSVQVGTKKAAGEMHHVARSAVTHRLLAEAVAERIAAMPAGVPRPKVHLYGESYGAGSSQLALDGKMDRYTRVLAKALGKWDGPVRFEPANTPEKLAEIGVDRALWVGTPRFGPLLRQLTRGPQDPRGAPQVGLVTPEVMRLPNLPTTDAISAEQARDVKMTFAQHPTDPVGLFNPRLLWEQGDWIGPITTRPEGVSRRQHWMPVITGIQTGIDQQRAQYFKAGTLESKGHDYRSSVTFMMRRAFGFDDMTDQQVGRVREWNRQLEVSHAKLQEAEKTRDKAPVIANVPAYNRYRREDNHHATSI